MREIKFRAWDKEKRIWVSNGEIECSLSEGDIVVCPNTIEHVGDSTHDMYVAKRFEVVQHTGLKDKNDVEIYEGDVVKVGNQEGDVYYDRYAFCVRHFWDTSQDTPGDAFSESDDIEVIGNIYENPELLDDGVKVDE